MCGLVGIISRIGGGLYGHDMDLFEDSLVIDTLRGKDSTGAFMGFRDTSARAIKHGSVPHELFKTRQWNDFRSDAINKGRFVIGHNRAATRGEVSTDNAHPFVEDNIILVHNGTLYGDNDKELTNQSCAVDSNAIAHALKEGTPEEVIPKINGAFALIWYNTETKKLYMVRNSQRPLSIITTKDKYFVASEPWMMACAYQRKAVNSEKILNTFEIEPYDLYSFDLDGKMSCKTLETPRPKVHSTHTGTPPPTVTGTSTDGTNDEVFPKESADKAGSQAPAEGVLRQAMEAVQTKERMTHPPRSNRCALTVVADGVQKTLTPTTGNDSTKILTLTSERLKRIDDELKLQQRSGLSATNDQTQPVCGTDGLTTRCLPTTNDMEIRAMQKNLADTPLYPQGRVVLFRVNSALHDYKSQPRFEGHLLEPGMEMVTVRGFLPETVVKGDMGLGAIYFTNISVHGPEIWLTNIEPCKYTKTHRRALVPQHLWSIAHRECVCDECDGHILLQDKAFTSIARKSIFGKTPSGNPLNVLQVLCANCVENKLPPGEYLEFFKSRRKTIADALQRARERTKASQWVAGSNTTAHPAVPEGVTGGFESSSSSSPLILLPGSPTIQ